MPDVTFTTETMQYIALFESLTGAHAKDCLVLDDEDSRIIFVVKSGDMGLAIGKNGNNINRVKKQIGRNVEVIEYNDDPKEFIKNLFQPAAIKNVVIATKGERQFALVDVASKDKGIAIGKNGRNINKVKSLAQRHLKIDDVIINQK
ncbi:NusA-like transcription termination signal-binding factor [Methanocella sp. CWC-04]|uniref:Probable transcription termination protein NusA n=1 Tax=Methanooceanicella nereidis TaxID=2052831 RepID=A0AAP2W563_9EURY|nr:NusA-like transcription termination signal-binding factor [Methanocella sp. CWC-04]